jgi:MbtH protein
MNDDREYHVVVNHEEQYSIWPVDVLPPPAGWRSAGFQGAKESCLQYIRKTWTDMRPLSLRHDGEEPTGTPS